MSEVYKIKPNCQTCGYLDIEVCKHCGQPKGKAHSSCFWKLSNNDGKCKRYKSKIDVTFDTTLEKAVKEIN